MPVSLRHMRWIGIVGALAIATLLASIDAPRVSAQA
jgi:hypothetical protein